MKAPNEFAAVQAFHRQWNGGAPIVDEAEKHRFTEAFVSQVLAPKDPRWGRKSRAAGAGPLSKDTVAYWLGPTLPTEPTDGQVDARDLLTSAGADSWNPDNDPAYNDIYARWFPVAPAASTVTTVASIAVEQPQTAGEPVGALLAALECRIRDHVDAAFAQLRAELHASHDALSASIVTALSDRLDPRFAGTEAAVRSALEGVPKEYELRYLGRVVGTLTPKT